MPEKQSNSNELLKFAIKTAKESAKILLQAQKKAKIVKHKKLGDYALDADYKSEQHIIERIRQEFPNHDILAEETGHKHKKSDYLWIIDPLEGTLNYAHNMPIWAINIALFYKNQPLIGVIYSPQLKELFYAQKNKGAYLNNKKIKVSTEKQIEKSFFSGPAHHLAQTKIPPPLLRALGCRGLELAYVANGRFEACIKLRGNDPYGYGAGSIIITEAGGKITDIKGKKWDLNSQGAIASNGKIHAQLIQIVNNIS